MAHAIVCLVRNSLRLKAHPVLCHNAPPRGIKSLVYVTLQPNESIDSALKRFNMKLQQSGVLRQLKEHSHYEKPSEKRAREKAAAVRRARKMDRKRAERDGVR